MKSTMTVSEVSGLLRESSLCIPEMVLVRSVMVSCEVALALAACSAFLLLCHRSYKYMGCLGFVS